MHDGKHSAVSCLALDSHESELILIWTGTEISILVASFFFFGPGMNNMTIICGH